MQDQRDKFQLKEGVTYINCAYMSPMLKSSEEKAIEGLKRKRNPFEISQEDFFTDVEEVKSLFGKIVNSEGKNIAYFPAVSYGFSSILNNINPRKGQEAILVSNEFPSGYFSADSWAKKHECSLTIIEEPKSISKKQDWSEVIVNQISEKTAFVLVSSVHWMDGTVFDLEKIGTKCRTVGAKLLVDGTQSVGARPMDVQKMKVDFLVCATYKWLFGPYSSAIGYISPEFSNGIPIEDSWMNRKNAHDFSSLANYEDHYFPDAMRYNVGQTNDFIKAPFLIESFKQILDWKVENIEEYCKNLLAPLKSYFMEIGLTFESNQYQAEHLLGINIAGKFSEIELLEDLKKNKVILSSRGNFLRFSPNVYNTSEEIEQLIHILKRNKI